MKNKNSEQIINALAEAGHFVTSGELAKTVGISTKTVYRTIRDLNQRYSRPIITSERGKGYYLDYDAYLQLSGQTAQESTDTVYSPIERRNEVVIELLFNAPRAMDIRRLYEKYYVSDDLIKQDLMVLSKTLKKHHLTLQRDLELVSIDGSEKDIRQALNAALVRSSAMERENI